MTRNFRPGDRVFDTVTSREGVVQRYDPHHKIFADGYIEVVDPRTREMQVVGNADYSICSKEFWKSLETF